MRVTLPDMSTQAVAGSEPSSHEPPINLQPPSTTDDSTQTETEAETTIFVPSNISALKAKIIEAVLAGGPNRLVVSPALVAFVRVSRDRMGDHVRDMEEFIQLKDENEALKERVQELEGLKKCLEDELADAQEILKRL